MYIVEFSVHDRRVGRDEIDIVTWHWGPHIDVPGEGTVELACGKGLDCRVNGAAVVPEGPEGLCKGNID